MIHVTLKDVWRNSIYILIVYDTIWGYKEICPTVFFIVDSLKWDIIDNNKFKKDIIVMCGEPSPGLTIEKANELFSKIETEKDIADLYAEVENKAWWIEDEQYDYDVGTDEYKVAREKTRMWFSLSDKLKEAGFNAKMPGGTFYLYVAYI